MNALMIKALGFAALLIIATIAVVNSLDMDVLADDMTAITMGGAIAVATVTAAVAVKYVNQIKTDTASGELADENWDGIGEYKNELPSGWAYSFLGLFLWSMWYGLVGYPVNAYSQIGEYNEEVLAYNAKFEETHKNVNVALDNAKIAIFTLKQTRLLSQQIGITTISCITCDYLCLLKQHNFKFYFPFICLYLTKGVYEKSVFYSLKTKTGFFEYRMRTFIEPSQGEKK